MYRNQLRSDRLNNHTATAPRVSRGSSGSTRWVVSGGRGSTALATRPRSPPYWSGRHGSVQQQYRPRSPAGKPIQGNATSYSSHPPPVGHTPMKADACASSESLDNVKPSNVTAQSDILSSVSAEGTWAIDFPTPTVPTKGYSSPAFALQFGTFSPEVTSKQCTTSSSSRPSALPDLKGGKHEKPLHGLCDKPDAVSSYPAQKLRKQEAMDDLVLGGGNELINKYENINVPELHETPMLNSIPPTNKVCMDSCTVLKRTPSSPAQLCQNQEERKDINVNRTEIAYKYPATKPKISVQIPASYTPNLVPPQFMLPVHGRSMHVPFQQKQPQVLIEFRGPGFQIQPIGSVSSSLPVKMTLPMGNVPHLQPVFVHGAQPHAFHQQSFIHQGQGFGYAPPANCHLPQFGSMRIAQELSQHHPRSNDEQKRIIKITHPETHEELMLDRRNHSFLGVHASRHMPLNNINQLSQPVQRFSPLHKVYYPRVSTYNSAPIYVPNSSTVSLASRQNSSKIQPTMQGFYSTNSNSLRPPMPSSWTDASSRALPNLNTDSEGLSAPGHVELKSNLTFHVEKNEVSLKCYGESTLSNQKNDCKFGLEISPKPKIPVSEGNLEVPVVASNMDLSKGVPTKQTQNQQASVYYVTPTVEPQTILTNNLPPLASTASSTYSIKAKPIGMEESLMIPTTSSSHTKLVSIHNNDSGRTDSVILTSTSFISNIDGTSQHNRNSKYDGHSILGKPPLIQTQEMVLPKFAGSNTSTEDLRKAKVNHVPFLDEKTELNGSVPLQNHGFMIKEQVANEEGMCSESKTQQVDATMTSTAFRLDDETSFAKLGRFGAYHQSVDLHPSISIDNVETSDDNQQPSSHAHIFSSQSENMQNNSRVDSDIKNAPFVSNSANFSRKIGQERIDPEVYNPCSLVCASVLQTKKVVMESTKAKSTNGRRKKQKEMLSKVSGQKYYDLDSEPISPSENIDSFIILEDVQSSLTIDLKQNHTLDAEKYSSIGGNDNSNIIDFFDSEDRTENSEKKLKVFGYNVADVNKGKCESDHKRYSRDFLLTFAQSCIELPKGFKIGFDIFKTVMSVQVGASFIDSSEPNPTHARIKDRGSATSRANRHMASKFDDDKWRKQFSSPISGHNMLSDNAQQIVFSSWETVHHGGHGPTRSLPQSKPFGQYNGEMISRTMKERVYQHSMSRGCVDERWQNRTNAQGISSPYQVSIPVIHKAEKKYEIGKVSDEEEAKQRQLKAILNKLTPQNFEKLFAQVKELNIDNVVTLTGVISQIFDKALMEPTFCEMYASFCFRLASDLPNFVKNDEKITFKRLLLNKCQEEFERGKIEQAEADKPEEVGGTQEGGGEEKRIRARRRMLGNIRLIGELYKKKMLTERIMHECINKLLGEYQNPDEEDLEALCKLMSTIGEIIDHSRAKAHMDFYFDLIKKLSENLKLSSRIRFLLEDVTDLRKNKWRQRRKVEGPKKIEEVRRDAIKQKFGQSTRFSQSSVTNNFGLRLGPLNNSLRGSSLLASRGSSQVRRYGSQNINLDDRYQPSNRAFLVPLHQRRADKSIRIGPQGDLRRGMLLCEKPLVYNDILPEVPLKNHDGQTTENSGVASNPTNFKAGKSSWGIADLSSSILPIVDQTACSVRNETCTEAQTFPEGVLREKTILTIKEFYNAKDEKEVALCMKELNASSFYPSVVSLWINDSFERKYMERELLAKLLVYLCKTQEHLLSQRQLLNGFQHVLSTLKDAVTDAPKATMFLGQIFARVILEDVISLTEIGELLQEQDGSEEATHHALDDSLMSEVMGSMLESIRVERGDSAVDEIRTKSNPPCSKQPRVCV